MEVVGYRVAALCCLTCSSNPLRNALRQTEGLSMSARVSKSKTLLVIGRGVQARAGKGTARGSKIGVSGLGSLPLQT